MSRACADKRPLIQQLGQERDLPWIVTDLIARLLDHRDLLVLSAVCHRLRSDALTIFYEHLDLDFTDPDGAGKTAVLLLRTLTTNRDIALRVKRLAFVGEPLRAWRKSLEVDADEIIDDVDQYFARQATARFPKSDVLTSSWNADEFVMARVRDIRMMYCSVLYKQPISYHEVCLDILKLASNVEELCVSSDFFRDDQFRRGFDCTMKSGRLHKLRSCDLCTDLAAFRRDDPREIGAVRDWTEAISSPFFASAMTDVKLVLAAPLDFSNMRALPVTTRLSICHYQTDSRDALQFLECLPHLKALTYDVKVDRDLSWRHQWAPGTSQYGAGLQAFFEVLFECVDHDLEELSISEEFLTAGFFASQCHKRCRETESHDQLHVLKTFPKLQKLRIPYHALFGCTAPHARKRDWPEILPPTIREVSLTDESLSSSDALSWGTNPVLLPVVRDMLSWMTTLTDKPGQIKFELSQKYSHSDLQPHTREELMELCSTLGVSCSIQVRDAEAQPPMITLRQQNHRRKSNKVMLMAYVATSDRDASVMCSYEIVNLSRQMHVPITDSSRRRVAVCGGGTDAPALARPPLASLIGQATPTSAQLDLDETMLFTKISEVEMTRVKSILTALKIGNSL